MGEGASLPTVWRHAIADADLTPTQKLVGLMIGTHFNGSGEAFPSVPVLAAECRLDRSTVKRARAILVKRGFLVMDEGGGRHRTNRYMAAIPAHQRARLAEKGVHQRQETGAPPARNRRTGAPRGLQEVHIEGAPRDGRKRQEPDRYHVADEDCRCQTCLDGHRAVPDAS
jgi:DNA-binding transcriptional MocR family regulator